jgi:glyoxylase-like metal-dependent hydrolase (beta-lactamase superfamily II)
MIQFCVPLGAINANCYILADNESKEAIVIDPGDFTDELKKVLTDGEIKKVKYILLTHGHYDHILGVYDLQQYTGAQVGINRNDARCLESELDSGAGHRFKEVQKSLTADFYLEDGMSLIFGETGLTVLFTPGHTPGGVCFICESEKKIFSGDTLFYHTIGRTDLPGGNMADMKNSLRRIIDLKGDYSVFPGHDRSTSLDEERQHNKYLRGLS